MYDFVWIPKYRHKIFVEPYRSSLKDIIEKIGCDYNIEVVELEIPEDHIHLEIRSEPKLSPSKVMQVMKSISARELLDSIQKSKSDISGEASYGLKAISLKLSVM